MSPHQPTALAEMGWLEWESGSQSKSGVARGQGSGGGDRGGRRWHRASSPPALYLGTIEVDRGNAAAAVVQYRKFLADHPPATWVKDYAAEIRTAFTHAGQPIPAGVPAASG